MRSTCLIFNGDRDLSTKTYLKGAVLLFANEQQTKKVFLVIRMSVKFREPWISLGFIFHFWLWPSHYYVTANPESRFSKQLFRFSGQGFRPNELELSTTPVKARAVVLEAEICSNFRRTFRFFSPRWLRNEIIQGQVLCLLCVYISDECVYRCDPKRNVLIVSDKFGDKHCGQHHGTSQ